MGIPVGGLIGSFDRIHFDIDPLHSRLLKNLMDLDRVEIKRRRHRFYCRVYI